MIFTAEKAIKDLGDKVTESEKTEINELIDKAKKAMEENNIEEIKSSKDKLAEEYMKKLLKHNKHKQKVTLNKQLAKAKEKTTI